MSAREKEPRRDRGGDCYGTAARLLLSLERCLGARLVHGVATLRRDGVPGTTRFGHAWVEVGDVVLDFSNETPRVMRRDVYYWFGDVCEKKCRYYDIDDTRDAILKNETYGPWPGEPAARAAHSDRRPR